MTEIVSGYEIDGTTLTLGSNNTIQLSLYNTNTWTAPQNFDAPIYTNIINMDSGQTTLTGTTAGSIVYSMPFQGTTYKKVLVYLNGYENDTTTAQTITFPTAFSYAPNVYNPAAVPGVTASTTALSIDPDTTTVYTAWIFVEGF